MRCSCGLPMAPTPKNHVGALIDRDLYAIMANCDGCGSTRCAIMWCDESAAVELALHDLLEQVAEYTDEPISHGAELAALAM